VEDVLRINSSPINPAYLYTFNTYEYIGIYIYSTDIDVVGRVKKELLKSMRDSAGSVVPIFVGKTIRHTKFHNTSSINTPLVIIRSVVVKQKPTHHSRFERSSDCCGRGECGSCSCSCCPASGVSTGRASGLQFRRIPGGHFGGGRRTTDRRRIFKK
jgi:hypothetical protein